MKEESDGCRTAAAVSNAENPPKHLLCHLEGLWVGYEEEDESAVEGVFGLEGCVGGHLSY